MNPRLDLLRPYPFERLRTLFAGAVPPASLPHIPLAIREPRHAPPAFVGEALTRALVTLGSYPLALGLPELRGAIAQWLERRFALPAGAVNAESMVLPLNGTREGLFAFVQATVDAGRTSPAVLMPSPFYQIYEGAALLAGAEPVYLPTGEMNGWLPDLDSVPAATWKRCQLLYLCSPGNPTGAVMDGGIIIPDTAKEKPMEGKVIAVGAGSLNKEGKRTPLEVKAGDGVLFGKYAGTEIKIDDDEMVILREDEILGIIE